MDVVEMTHYEMKYAANEINRIATEVAGLNDLVQNQEMLVGDTGNVELQELVSRRDELISQLNELADVTSVHQEDGTTSLYLGGGRLLVQADMSNEVNLSGIGVGPNYDIKFTVTSMDGQDLDPVKPIGGMLGGLKDSYDVAIRDGVNRVDEVAFEFIEEFNSRHQAGFGLNGATGLDFFEPIAAQDGASGNIEVAIAIDEDMDNIAAASAAGNLPGGNGNLVSLADCMTDPGTMPDGSSFYEAWVDYRADITTRIQRAAIGVQTERASAEQLNNLFQNEAGVSLDEEMVMMSQAKTAFDAASQIIRAADEMAQTVLMMVR
jgi:flagellar hook-associated protein 1 FlgK